MKKLIIFVFGLLLTTASFALTPIVGTLSGCIGTTTSLGDTTGGGYWTSSNPAVAIVGSTDGSVTPESVGTTTITYTVGSSYVTATYAVVGTSPAPITGTTSLCIGTPAILSDATTGGVWSSSYTFTATVGSLTGVVTPVASGGTTIEYTVGACSVSTVVSIGYTVIDSVTGPTTVCVGSTITLADLTAGGTWSSSNVAIATVNVSTGVVTGVSAGWVNIFYNVTGCGGPSSEMYSVHVSAGTSAGTISGASTDYVGATTTLSETATGGSWYSSNTAVATIGVSSGVVTGVSNGTTLITYAVLGCSGAAFATYPMTITTDNIIAGTVYFGGADSTSAGDTLKLWLITFNSSTSMLEASDSFTTVLSSYTGSYAYQFLGEPTDTYRVKAALHPTAHTAYGYLPTYHTSSLLWSSANVINHTGTADLGEDINMIYGPDTTTGPGFIGGNVTLGADRGTSSALPAVGLLMVCETSTGTILQQTLTDASGNYSFSNLPIGTYTVHPELLNYTSTDYTSINLTSAVPSLTNAGFIRHTVSLTITPFSSTGVATVKQPVSGVIAYPNPTSGKLNIQWMETSTENATVSISDITGREIYKTSINMTQGTGINQVDLSNLSNGLYLISINSGNINYNNKVDVRH